MSIGRKNNTTELKKKKNLRECVTAARHAACRSGVAAAVRWDSGWNNILSDQI